MKVFILFVVISLGFCEECNELITKSERVCVCNSTYCDTLKPINVPQGGYQVLSTSSSKLGHQSQQQLFENNNTSTSKNVLTINYDMKQQTVIGFGGAFTDSTGINIKSLPQKTQTHLLDSIFSEKGAQYSICRVPIGGTDFSTRGYTYDDEHEDDIDLQYFALQPEDYKYKIPYIQKALQLTNNSLKLFGSPWSAPLWMKTNNKFSGVGFLKDQYYQVWANYFLKFFESYAKEGIQFWGVTTQNEPFDGFIPNFLSKVNAMGFTVGQMNKWVGQHLGPTIRNSNFSNLKIMLFDDNRQTLISFPLTLNNDEVLKYADGVAIHWYADFVLPDSLLKNTRTDKKDLFLINTEACNGYLSSTGIEKAVDLGSWSRAEKYLNSIFNDFQYGAGGWLDWNIVLNEQGGPTYVSNFVDASIIVKNSTGEFFKQPMHYIMAHFSKYIISDSVKIHTTKLKNLRTMAFLRPDNLTAVIIYNPDSSDTNVQIDTKYGSIVIDVEAHSLNTVLF